MNPKAKKVRQILAAVMVAAAFAGFTSCDNYKIEPAPFDKESTWSYKADIQPIFINNRCTECHPSKKSPDLRIGKSYASLTGVVKYVNPPETAETSRLYLKLYSTSPTNHKDKTTENEKLMVLYWIKQGAKYN
jgi:hypothetical protein